MKYLKIILFILSFSCYSSYSVEYRLAYSGQEEVSNESSIIYQSQIVQLKDGERFNIVQRDVPRTIKADHLSNILNGVTNSTDNVRLYIKSSYLIESENTSYLLSAANNNVNFSINTAANISTHVVGNDYLYGPGVVIYKLEAYLEPAKVGSVIYDFSLDRVINYSVTKIDNTTTDKFSVAIDDDGDRVVVGYKEPGTNAVVRVYEFDGSSWNQLGENLD